VEMRQEVVQFIREDEGFSVSLHAQLLFASVKEVAKIYVEEASGILLQHEVGRVPVANAHHVGGDALASK
jgi:hypothetical protein